MVTRRYRSRAKLAAAIISGALLASSTVRADRASSDPAAAQALFDRAKGLMAQGRANEACPMLEESQRLDPASGTLINLADCYEQQGRIAAAWGTFLEAAAAARVAGYLERESAARLRASALAPRLSRIVIDVAAKNTPGLEIRRDGSVVGKAQWGTPIPVDRGEHRVTASAPGRKSWESVLSVKDTAATELVSVPELEQQPGADASSARLGSQRTWALVAGAVGTAGIATGTVFAFVSKSKQDEANQHCNGSACRDLLGVDLRADAMAYGNVATIAFIAGASALAGGAVLWLTGKPQPPVSVGVGPERVVVGIAW
jgi:tetratricopeptide (TPR) repeat protein